MRLRIAREKLKRGNFVTHNASPNKIHTSLIHVLRKVIEKLSLIKTHYITRISGQFVIHVVVIPIRFDFGVCPKYGEIYGRQR